MSVALITGASRGIGRATAFYLAERGMHLILLGRASEAQTETEERLRERGAPFSFYKCELSDRVSADKAVKLVLAQEATPDVLIHNAATIDRRSVSELSDELWDRQIEVNLTAPFRLSRAFLPAMLKRGSGRILFVSSISAVVGTKEHSAYHASKAGLLGLMRCLAEEVSDTGVSAMALLPGSVDTRMLKGTPFAPRMTAEELARTLGFYALDASGAHNGASVEMFGI